MSKFRWVVTSNKKPTREQCLEYQEKNDCSMMEANHILTNRQPPRLQYLIQSGEMSQSRWVDVPTEHIENE